MAFDIKKWLTDDLGLSGDDLALVETKLAPKASVIESGYLRQSDYSTKMNDITALQTAVTKKDADLAAEATEWANLTAAEQRASTGLRASLNKKEAEALALRQELEVVATQAGLDPAVILAKIVTAPAPATPAAPVAPDMSGYVTTEQYQGLVATAVRLPAMLQTLTREHKALTGEDLDTEALVTEMTTRAQTRNNAKSLDPRAIWEETHQIAAKRAAKADADLQRQLTAAREEGAIQARTEAALPGSGTPRGTHSPVFTRPGADQSVLKRGQPGEGHRTAVAAFTSGKYRPAEQKTA